MVKRTEEEEEKDHEEALRDTSGCIKTTIIFIAVMLFIGFVVSGIADLVGCETEYEQLSPEEQMEREAVEPWSLDGKRP